MARSMLLLACMVNPANEGQLLDRVATRLRGELEVSDVEDGLSVRCGQSWVRVGVVDHDDGVRATARICRDHLADPRAVLREAAHLSGGAVALVKGEYVVHLTLSAPSAEERIGVAVRYVARIAEELAATFRATCASMAMETFAHYS